MVDVTRSVDPAEKLREAGAEEQEGEGRDVDAAGRLSAADAAASAVASAAVELRYSVPEAAVPDSVPVAAAEEVFRFQVGDIAVAVPIAEIRKLLGALFNPLTDALSRPEGEQLSIAGSCSADPAHADLLDGLARKTSFGPVRLELASNPSLLPRTQAYLAEVGDDGVLERLVYRSALDEEAQLIILERGDSRMLNELARGSYDLGESVLSVLVKKVDVGVLRSLQSRLMGVFTPEFQQMLIDRNEPNVDEFLARLINLGPGYQPVLAERGDRGVLACLLNRKDLAVAVQPIIIRRGDSDNYIQLLRRSDFDTTLQAALFERGDVRIPRLLVKLEDLSADLQLPLVRTNDLHVWDILVKRHVSSLIPEAREELIGFLRAKIGIPNERYVDDFAWNRARDKMRRLLDILGANEVPE